MKRLLTPFIFVKDQGVSIVKHPLFSGSFVMVFGSNLANFIAYIYHLVFGRILGPTEYGELATILSILALSVSIYSFTGIVIVKVVSSLDEKELKPFYEWLAKYAKGFAIAVSFLILFLSPVIADFIHVRLIEVILISPIFFFMLLVYVYRGFLQGMLEFTKAVVLTNIEFLGRLLFGFLLIWMGFSVLGAILGILISIGIVFLLARKFLRKLLKNSSKNVYYPSKELFSVSLPMMLYSFASIAFFSTDLILVKHFFPTETAGLYAALSTLGKIIFYGSGPVSAVMFPMVSKRHSKGQGYRKIFLLSFLLTTSIAFFVLAIYYFFPELSVRILYGDKYNSISGYLIYFGLYMGVFTLVSLFFSYFLSSGKAKLGYLMLVGVLMQAAGIWFYHQDIIQVITVCLTVSVILLIFLVGRYILDDLRGK